jgi:hypothetical protein
VINRVLRIFGAAGIPLDDRNVADALWLARILPAAPPDEAVDTATAPATPPAAEPERAPAPAPAAERRRVRISSAKVLRDEQELFATRSGEPVPDGITVGRVRVPAAPGLHGALAIARSLRPLGRRFPSRQFEALDEVATAEQSAEMGVLTPVFRPGRERWFEVALVVEDIPSLVIWRRVIAEFHQLLQRQGAFRDVRRWTLSIAGAAVHVVDPAGVARPSRELRDPEGRRLILVVSDCLSPAWYSRAMAGLLADWGVTTPVAVLQLLPDHLWTHTALGSPRARLHAAVPGVPNSRLLVDRPWWDDEPLAGELPLPVLTLDARSIGEWSRMVMGLGSRVRGIVVDRHLLAPNADGGAVPGAAVPPVDPEARIARFRSLVSADAYRLAAYLALVPLTFPVIRLVQAAMMASASESQLAEVLLGGIIERVTPAGAHVGDDEVEYEFASTPEEEAPGRPDTDRGSAMRNVLLSSVRHSELSRVLGAVSRYVTERVGTPVDFTAWARSEQGTETLPEGARPFARLAASAMRRLGRPVTEGSLATSGVGPETGAGSATATIEVEEEVFTAGLTLIRLVELSDSVRQLAWSPDGTRLALRHDRAVSIVDPDTGRLVDRHFLRGSTALVWSQDSRRLVVAARNAEDAVSTINIFHPESRESVVGPHRAPVVDVDWRRPYDEIVLGLANGQVRFRREGDRRGLYMADDLPDRPDSAVRALSWSNSGMYLAVLYGDGALKISATDERKLDRQTAAEALRAEPGPLCWEPRDRWLAVSRTPGRVSVVDNGLRPLRELTMSAEVQSLSFSADGNFLLATASDGELLVWRTANWTTATRREGHAGGSPPRPVAAFSPRAPVLALAEGAAVRLLRVDEQALLAAAPVARDDRAAPPEAPVLGVRPRAAVLIAVGRHPGLETLHAAYRGLALMRRWANGQPGMEGRVDTLSDEFGTTVTREDVASIVEKYASLGSIDQLVVYFAGYSVKAGDELWMFTTGPGRRYVNVDFSAARARFCRIPHVVLISDTCRTSPGIVTVGEFVENTVFRFPEHGVHGLVDVFSFTEQGSPAGKDATPRADAFQAVYTAALVDGLSGKRSELVEPADEDPRIGRVYAHSLSRYLQEEVPRRLRRVEGRNLPRQLPYARITSDPKSWLAEIPLRADESGQPLREYATRLADEAGSLRSPFVREVFLTDVYVAPRLRRVTPPTREPVALEEVLRATPRALILGAPGTGKSALLSYLALAFAEAWRESAWPRRSRPLMKLELQLPFLIRLRDTVNVDLTAGGVVELLLHEMAQRAVQAKPEQIHELLNTGRCALLFDGLDEVSEGDGTRVAELILSVVYHYPACRVLVTARPSTPVRMLAQDFTSFAIEGLTDDEAAEFLQRLLRAGDIPRSQIADIMATARSRDTADLLRTPLGVQLMAAAAITHRGSIPLSRGELYRTLLYHELKRLDVRLDPIQVSRWLADIALRMELAGPLTFTLSDARDAARMLSPPLRDSDVSDFFWTLVRRSTLVVEIAPGEFQFAFRGLQEFLAATEFVERGLLREIARLDPMDARWDNILALAAESMDPEALRRLLDRLIDGGKPGELVLVARMLAAFPEASLGQSGDVVRSFSEALLLATKKGRSSGAEEEHLRQLLAQIRSALELRSLADVRRRLPP